MKSYLVVVTSEEEIEVEADSEEEAVKRAIDIASTCFSNAWEGQVIHTQEVEE